MTDKTILAIKEQHTLKNANNCLNMSILVN